MILDANVVIAALNAEGAHHADAVDVLAEAAGEPLRMPELTLAEAFVAHARAGTAARAAAVLDELGVEMAPAAGDPMALARLRAESGLRMPDCVVLQCAERQGEPLVTFDRRLAQVAVERGVRVLPA